MLLDNTEAEEVECTDVYLPYIERAPCGQIVGDARHELSCRLLGERSHEDVAWYYPALKNQVGYALDECERLPGSRSGRDEQKAFRGPDGSELIGVCAPESKCSHRPPVTKRDGDATITT